MTKTGALHRLARVILDAPVVEEETLDALLGGLSRTQLKGLAAALRRESARRSVRLTVAGAGDRPAAEGLAPLYGGRSVEVSTDPSLGAGIKAAAGDDIVDASLKGMIRAVVDGVRRT